jgi:hypothetical protein
MENWKDFVGFQPIQIAEDEKFEGGMVFYLQVLPFENLEIGQFNIEIRKALIPPKEYNILSSEIENKIEEVLKTFPAAEARDQFQLQRLRTNVAIVTRRGAATTNFENVWYYNGKNVFDRPVVVSEYKGKYAIWKHPDFEKYGFRVITGENNE